MEGRVRLVRLDPVADDQAVEQARQILEAGLRRSMLSRVERQALGSNEGGANAKGHEA